MKLEPAAGEQGASNVVPIASARLARADTARVLPAEDNEVNALVTGAFLGRAGVAVDVVENGSDAVQRAMAAGARPDTVFMNVRMPTLDGLGATRLIRVQEQQRGLGRLPIAGLAATASEEDRQRCIADGMDDCLAMPWRDVDLVRATERFMGRTTRAPAQLGSAGNVPSDDRHACTQ